MSGGLERRDGKTLVEDCLTIDLAWLMGLGPIGTGQAGGGEIGWYTDGQRVKDVRFRLDLRNAESATLIICCGTICQTIALTMLPQYLGGHRWWMRCPVTGQRARTLHLPPGADRFASRKAWNLVYRVERLGRFDRPFEKLFRAQRKLGGEQRLGAELRRPKGMWRRTFDRHVARCADFDAECADNIVTLVSSPGAPGEFFVPPGGNLRASSLSVWPDRLKH